MKNTCRMPYAPYLLKTTRIHGFNLDFFLYSHHDWLFRTLFAGLYEKVRETGRYIT